MRYLIARVIFCITIFTLSAYSSYGSKLPDKDMTGYSPLHDLKYKENFTHFEYVNPQAPKGGKIRIGRQGTFNSLNFLKYPGRTPVGRGSLPVNLTSYLYDSLLVASSDEIAGYYGLLAKHIEVAENFKSVTFKIREDARWHDGTPITADDVIFTFRTQKKQGAPFYRQVFRSISVRKDGPLKVTFLAQNSGNRDFVRLVGTMPIHPKHYWDLNDVTKTTLAPPLASGSYKITRVDGGRFVRFERVPTYWGANHPVNIGRYNFDQIELSFFRDHTAAIEAFKANQYDIRLESDAVSWANAYAGEKYKSEKIQKYELFTEKPGGIVRLAFNLRRQLFKDRRVRKAFALMYDFDQVNRILFHNQYEVVTSRYGTTSLAAKGAATPKEFKLLQPFLQRLPSGILKAPDPAFHTASMAPREKLRVASQLLDDAGFEIENQKRIDPQTGQPLKLSVAYSNPRHQRVLSFYASALKQLGISLEYPSLEPVSASQKILSHDYDMVLLNTNPGLITGPREELLWSSRFTDMKKSYSFGGVKDKALDHLINIVKNARDVEIMQAATRAFDRVLRWQVYDILLWKKSKTWVATWNKFDHPKISPKYTLSFIDRWWCEKTCLKQSKIN